MVVWCCAVQGVELDLKKQDVGGEEKLKGGRKGTLEKEQQGWRE